MIFQISSKFFVKIYFNQSQKQIREDTWIPHTWAPMIFQIGVQKELDISNHIHNQKCYQTHQLFTMTIYGVNPLLSIHAHAPKQH